MNYITYKDYVLLNHSFVCALGWWPSNLPKLFKPTQKAYI